MSPELGRQEVSPGHEQSIPRGGCQCRHPRGPRVRRRARRPGFRKWQNVLDLRSGRGSMTPSISPNSQDRTPRKDGLLSTSVTAQWHRLRFEEVCTQSFGGLPRGSAVRTPCLHGRRHRFDPRLGNHNPACRLLVQPEEKKEIDRLCSAMSTFLSSNDSCALQPSHRRCCSCTK